MAGHDPTNVPSLFIPRPDFTLPPTASNKAIDEAWVLKVARPFFSGRPRAKWAEFYSWCAKKSDHRPAEYWAELNDNETALRKKIDKILEGIKESSGSHTKGEDDPRNRGPGLKSNYPEQLVQKMVKHLALNPRVYHTTRFWNTFHEKHPEKSAICYYCFHRNHKTYFDEEVKRFREQRGMNPRGAGAGSRVDDPDYSEAHSDSDSDDEECLGHESSTKNKKAQVYDQRRSAPGPFTDEEREEMKKFYRKMRPKCDTDSQVWDLFSKLHPLRSVQAYRRHALNHPEIREQGDEEDLGHRYQRFRRFTSDEDKLLIEWVKKKGFPKTISTKEWEQFGDEHPERPFGSWKDRYRKALRPVALEKRREQARGEKTVRLASTVPDLDAPGGVVATTSSSSSRVTRTYGRASLNSGPQLQRRRRAQDQESEMMGLRSKRLRTMDTDGVNDSSPSPVESNERNSARVNVTTAGDREHSEEIIRRMVTPVRRRDENNPPPPAQRGLSTKVEFQLPGHPKTIRTNIRQVGSKPGDDGDDDPSNCHTFISVEYSI